VFYESGMKNEFLLTLFACVLIPGLTPVQAGEMGYDVHRTAAAESRSHVSRYHQEMPYRHYEDRRRYNAAPYCDVVVSAPYIVKTIVVSKRLEPYHYVDGRGRTKCDRVLTVTYQTFYSDGSCQVWVDRG
jgi:hypothetical protein